MHILTPGTSANGLQKQLDKSTEHKVISDYEIEWMVMQ